MYDSAIHPDPLKFPTDVFLLLISFYIFRQFIANFFYVSAAIDLKNKVSYNKDKDIAFYETTENGIGECIWKCWILVLWIMIMYMQ